ncbi:bifunctional adenosylcobinamide kinase/adenosylcobinamide-phosphate guanylyltransferase [Catellatospora bangladeshensis]
MSHDGQPTNIGARVLVLGGIRSGKSEFAESLLLGARSVRYLATALADGGDPAFAERVAAHRARRPHTWVTLETYGDPDALPSALQQATAEETLLVDDLGGWVVSLLDRADAQVHVSRLAAAVASCPARVVLVSPEVGLSVVPPTEAGVRFADLLGLTNQAVAAACDSVALVVAGQPAWLRRPDTETGAAIDFGTASVPDRAALGASTANGAAAQPAGTPGSGAAQGAGTPGSGAAQGATAPGGTAAEVAAAAALASTTPASADPAQAAPATEYASPEVFTPAAAPRPSATADVREAAAQVPDSGLVIEPGMNLPIPDSDARDAAREHLDLLDIPGSGLGRLAEIVLFAAAAQGRAVPAPWARPRLLLLHGDHEGGVAAGQSPGRSARTAADARQGEGPIGLLAAEQG